MIELLVVVAIISLLMSILLPALGLAKEQARTVVCLTNLKGLGTAFNSYTSTNKDYVVPFEYRLDLKDAWCTILPNFQYIAAPREESELELPKETSILRCPSGLPVVGQRAADGYWPIPASRQDPMGAWAIPFESNSADKDGESVWVHAWYGLNADSWAIYEFPFCSYPQGGTSAPAYYLRRSGTITQPSDMVVGYDGIWTHNGHAWQRINARHARQTKTNIFFFDGHSETVDAAKLPIGNMRPKTDAGTWDEALWPLWRIDHQRKKT